MKKIMILVLSVCISGCSSFTRAQTYEQAKGKVTIDGKAYSMIIGEFEWVDENSEARKLNPININDLADQFKTVEVGKGDKLTIDIEQNPSSVIVDQWNEEGELQAIELNGNEIPIPIKSGLYIYEVTAGWNEGKISYVFDISIQ
ncbi:hypothetical protein [Ureibacillus aquaedulcis]|uniref:Lipoprotein n=1 Tax=Ureibacillus aquaedulcis TaxID=3058421 RepID=A0ABT8GN49_9BACL|nr:hypothetical protein [Ureibacillus sp. BA0131]MDN4492838.1 hypothetical protein [Ureibacillus sp. BA0131]